MLVTKIQNDIFASQFDILLFFIDYSRIFTLTDALIALFLLITLDIFIVCALGCVQIPLNIKRDACDVNLSVGVLAHCEQRRLLLLSLFVELLKVGHSALISGIVIKLGLVGVDDSFLLEFVVGCRVLPERMCFHFCPARSLQRVLLEQLLQ